MGIRDLPHLPESLPSPSSASARCFLHLRHRQKGRSHTPCSPTRRKITLQVWHVEGVWISEEWMRSVVLLHVWGGGYGLFTAWQANTAYASVPYCGLPL